MEKTRIQEDTHKPQVTATGPTLNCKLQKGHCQEQSPEF